MEEAANQRKNQFGYVDLLLEVLEQKHVPEILDLVVRRFGTGCGLQQVLDRVGDIDVVTEVAIRAIQHFEIIDVADFLILEAS